MSTPSYAEIMKGKLVDPKYITNVYPSIIVTDLDSKRYFILEKEFARCQE